MPLATCQPEVAVTVMDLMDYPVHLFVDADTGRGQLIYRRFDTRYALLEDSR